MYDITYKKLSNKKRMEILRNGGNEAIKGMLDLMARDDLTYDEQLDLCGLINGTVRRIHEIQKQGS